jgi:hypothetical protein
MPVRLFPHKYNFKLKMMFCRSGAEVTMLGNGERNEGRGSGLKPSHFN